MNTYHFYTARMSPAFNRSSALERFEHSNEIEIHNRIMFDFYPGLPHIHTIYTRSIYILSIQEVYTHYLYKEHIHTIYTRSIYTDIHVIGRGFT